MFFRNVTLALQRPVCSINLKLIAFDITNVYTNIPVTDLLDVIKLMCERNNTGIKLSQEILRMYKIITQED